MIKGDHHKVKVYSPEINHVSSLVRVLNGYYKEDQHRTVGNDSNSEKSTALIDRDLLGGLTLFLLQPLSLWLIPRNWTSTRRSQMAGKSA
uniref:Uncharacterized protein n=1 Tax=Quercus lobata TaxID=97700 RepID=A0A7N2LHP8_QUELO